MVTGATGQVGVDLVDMLRGARVPGADPGFQPDERRVETDEFEVLALSRHELDVTDRDAVVGALRTTRPEVVVHLAAYTAVDRAETEPERCNAVNADGTESMSLAAREVGARLIAISTDYVFDGEKGSAYVETDETNPLNVYGASKRAGEVRCGDEDLVVRTSWVMGVRGRNVAHVIADRASSGATVRFVNDQMGTVTVASDLARALVTLVRERPQGLWHVANQSATTWFDIAVFIGELLGRGADFATAISTQELSPTPLARRPARSDLDTTKFAHSWTALPDWHDALTRLVRDRVSEVRS